ncbi:DNA sulfur modification protein DndB [Oxynema sp. CENA135]|uniref:DNA sulfur modification protein DndB n=1 Tax=Oxynema sp. CENA135 TaxID=984206 RepID=UPI00190C6C58|nr:DNA sulfur modification protein DndB [Oxynema sp. CENA135]MBK4732678.1 DNA sulfur modification protein DndB [Oxynema sp. CENA135]
MTKTTFEYVLPAIRGIQAGREYYVSMCPVRFLPKLFPLEGEDNPPQARSRRHLNLARVRQIARYILENPETYTFCAITASIDGEVAFEPMGEKAEERKMGRLRVPMDARFTIDDGQHRRAALELALKENPDLGYETIAAIFFLDLGLARSQEVFNDLNAHAVRPDPSLSLLYNRRDRLAVVTRGILDRVEVFAKLTETERSHIPVRSAKLFTLTSLYRATAQLLADRIDLHEGEDPVELAIAFWSRVAQSIPDWRLACDRQISARELREDSLHGHGIVLAALGLVGLSLLETDRKSWGDRLAGLRAIDWSRSNKNWRDRVVFEGRVCQGSASISYLTAYLKQHLELPLTVEEKQLLGDRL